MRRRLLKSGRDESPKQKRHKSGEWTIYICAVTSALLSYANSLKGDFVHDDIPAIVTNGDVIGTNNVKELFLNDFWGTPMSDVNSHKSYRPLTTLTFRLNHSLHGLSAWWYHACNALLHATCCALVARACLKVVRLQKPFAALASVLFAVHPIHTEAVTGIVGRADILACIFFLSSLLVYHGSSNGNQRVFLSILLGGLSMLAKENGITVLIVNISLDFYKYWPSVQRCFDEVRWNKTTSNLLFRNGKVFVSLLLLIMVRLALLQGSFPTFSQQDNPAAFHPNFLVRFMTFGYLAAFNWWLLLCPNTLSHDWQMGSIPLVTFVKDPRNIMTCATFGAVILLSYCCITDFKIHRHMPLIIGFLVMVIPYIPASNIFLTVGFVVAERVLYIPSVGSVILTVYGLQLMWSEKKSTRTILCAGIVILTISGVAKTYQRNEHWRTKASLLRADLATVPHNAKLHYNYGNYFKDNENQNSAKTHYREAIRLWPSYASAHNNLGTLTVAEGNAEFHFLQAISFSKNHVNAHFNLGKLYRKSNRLQEALKILERSIMLEPQFVQAYLELALIKSQNEKGLLYRKVISLEPDKWEHRLLYGKWLRIQGFTCKSVKYFEDAFRIRILTSAKEKHKNSAVIAFRYLALELRKLGRTSRIFQLMTRWQVSIRPQSRKIANNIYLREWKIKLELSCRAKAYTVDNSPKHKTCYDHSRLEVDLKSKQVDVKKTGLPNISTQTNKLPASKTKTSNLCKKPIKQNSIAISVNYKPTHNKSEPGHKQKICSSIKSNKVKGSKEFLAPLITNALINKF